MLNLVVKDIVRLKTQLLTLLGVMVAGSILVSYMAPTFLSTILFTYPIVYSLIIPQLLFLQEECGNTFHFPRPLSIRLVSIVAAKYMVSILTPLSAIVAISLAGLLGALTTETALGAMFGSVLICFILSALSLFLHFWLGTKKGKTALSVVIFSLSIFSFRITEGKGAFLIRFATRIKPLATSPFGILVSIALGLLILGASLAGCFAIFSRRNLSNLP